MKNSYVFITQGCFSVFQSDGLFVFHTTNDRVHTAANGAVLKIVFCQAFHMQALLAFTVLHHRMCRFMSLPSD